MALKTKLVLLSATFLAVSACAFTATWLRLEHASSQALMLGVIGLLSLCLAGLVIAILSLPLSPHGGIRGLLLHLFFAARSYLKGKLLLRRARRTWKNPRAYQTQFLLRVLSKNAQTDYGRRFQFKYIKSREEFRKHHPLISYKEYQPFIERVMEGERNVLTPEPIPSFIKTSGTTGKSKFFGHLDKFGPLEDSLDMNFAVVKDLIPSLSIVQKHVHQYVDPIRSKAKSGGTIDTIMSLGDWGKLYTFSSPPEGFRIHSFKMSNYVQLVFALREPNIGVFISTFTSSIDSLMKQLHKEWEDIVRDIEQGTINSRIELPDDIRASLLRELQGGDPQRARNLREECLKGFDGIMMRVWPKLAVVLSVDNGQLWSKLQQTYAKGVPLVAYGYGSSEAILAAISPWFWEERPEYVFLNTSFFEFIRSQDVHENQPPTYFLDELEVGQDYEVVITNESGLCRYRMGDVIRIAGFHHNMPTFQFLYRLGLVLNLRYEKMNSDTLRLALHSAVGRWAGVGLVEYAAAESTLVPDTCSAFEESEIMPYYLIFMELEPDRDQTENYYRIPQDEIAMIDEELRRLNSDYDRLRRENAISHPRVHIVKPGTFDALKDYVLAHTNASGNQYKIPRKLRTAETLELLLHRSY